MESPVNAIDTPNRTLLCGVCGGEREARFRRITDAHTVHGETFDVATTCYECLSCGEELADPAAPDMMMPIYDAYRAKLGLLSPAKIREIRTKSGLSQVAFATLLGMSPATINGYELGSPHNPTEDVIFRLAALPGAVPMLLRTRGHLLKPGQRPGR